MRKSLFVGVSASFGSGPRRRNRGVTLKAINFDGCIGMAALTELTAVVNGDELSLVIFADMAANAVLEAMLFGTNTFMHGLIALMQDEFEVTTTHHIRGFNTGFALIGGGEGRQ